MKGRMWWAFQTCLMTALSGPVSAGVAFDNTPTRTLSPNGFVMQAVSGVADDFTLDADAIVTGGRLWTWEQAGIAEPSLLNYAFWADADVASLIPTKPAANPLAGSTGVATVTQRTSAGPNQVIGGVEYAPYEYLFALEQPLGVPASTPLWLSFNVPDSYTGTDGRYLWALNGNLTDPYGAWGTTNIDVTTGVDWLFQAQVGTTFVLFNDDVNPPNRVPLPSTLLLMLPALVGFRARRRAIACSTE